MTVQNRWYAAPQCKRVRCGFCSSRPESPEYTRGENRQTPLLCTVRQWRLEQLRRLEQMKADRGAKRRTAVARDSQDHVPGDVRRSHDEYPARRAPVRARARAAAAPACASRPDAAPVPALCRAPPWWSTTPETPYPARRPAAPAATRHRRRKPAPGQSRRQRAQRFDVDPHRAEGAGSCRGPSPAVADADVQSAGPAFQHGAPTGLAADGDVTARQPRQVLCELDEEFACRAALVVVDPTQPDRHAPHTRFTRFHER